MGRYYVDYNTGAGDKWVDGTIEEARKEADSGMSYTSADITIRDEDGNAVCRRAWWGVPYDNVDYDGSDPIMFGSIGFYGDWQE